MDLMKAYQDVMQSHANMALATSVDGVPNVRVVTFGYNESTPKTAYFTTFKGNKKIAEFAQNPHVCFMPLPQGPDAPAQVRVTGKVQKSAKSLEEVAALILRKAPFFAQTLEQGGNMLEAYEVNFEEASVTIGMEDAQTLAL